MDYIIRNNIKHELNSMETIGNEPVFNFDFYGTTIPCIKWDSGFNNIALFISNTFLEGDSKRKYNKIFRKY